ncbi:DUF7158 domain-containing protein [Saccharothrix variisporea]|uniref:[acyl-carrier-protein] S-malonyltransferase n=1 Tax=Saccharothrix variisporea TaxID=543527 RepID=A0A495X660_9PSEU|nr:hypothetical protein [Saccharothrix variisporea]RKT68625.1 [acyl-carrier-protein] S-malonyltransferase [Saccharothrix variisporea]
MNHHHPSTKEAAARAQREAAVIGWVEDVPVPRAALDARLAALRTRPGALPKPGTSEDRQLVRWTAHVLLTEELCRREAAARSLPVTGHEPLDPVAAVQLGSIGSAAWQSCPEVGAVFAAVVPPVSVVDAGPVRRWWRVRYGEKLAPIGWTTLDDLPTPLADALRVAPLGTLVGPVEHGGRHHYAVADEHEDRPVDEDSPSRRSRGTRLREFSRWLDHRRAAAVRTAPGFEHPGDPTQPDCTHRH